jgi:hypothetical protein
MALQQRRIVLRKSSEQQGKTGRNTEENGNPSTSHIINPSFTAKLPFTLCKLINGRYFRRKKVFNNRFYSPSKFSKYIQMFY